MNFIERILNPLNIAAFILIALVITLISVDGSGSDKDSDASTMSADEKEKLQKAEAVFEKAVAEIPIENMISPCQSYLPVSGDIKRYDSDAQQYLRPTRLIKVELGEGKTLNITFGDDEYLAELHNTAVKFTKDDKLNYLQDVIKEIHPGLNWKLYTEGYTVNVTVTPYNQSAKSPSPVKYAVKY